MLPQEPVPAEPVVAEIKVEEISENISPAVAEPVPARHFQIEKPKYSAYPGLKIVVGLVLLAILAGAGIPWKLHAGRAIQSSTVNTLAAPVSQTTHPDTPAASSQNESADKTDEPTTVTDIRSWSSANSSTVVIELQAACGMKNTVSPDPIASISICRTQPSYTNWLERLSQ